MHSVRRGGSVRRSLGSPRNDGGRDRADRALVARDPIRARGARPARRRLERRAALDDDVVLMPRFVPFAASSLLGLVGLLGGCSTCGAREVAPDDAAPPSNDAVYAFVEDAQGGADLVTLDRAGPSKPTCPTPGRRSWPAVAPGGTHIAYGELTSSGLLNLHVMRADCTEDHVVASNAAGANSISHIAFSPDGRWLAYVGLVLRDASSPVGRTISFGDSDIFVVARDGGGAPVDVSNHTAEEGSPAWSPDGASLAFVSRRDGTSEVYTVRRDGTELTARTKEQKVLGRAIAWSTAGIAYGRAAAPPGIAVVPAAGGEPRLVVPAADPVITATFPGLELANPTWSPGGEWVAFVGTHLGGGQYTSRAFVAKRDGASLHALSSDQQITCLEFRSSTDLVTWGGGVARRFSVEGDASEVLGKAAMCPAVARPARP